MRRARPRPIRKAVIVILSVLALVLAVMVHQGYQEAKRQLPGFLSARLTEALGRPVTVADVGFRLPATFTLRRLRVEKLPDEEQPPLVAHRVRAGVSWWQLLVHRNLLVTGLTIERPQIFAELDLRELDEEEPDPAESLLALRNSGLRNLRILDANAQVVTILPNGQRETVRTAGLDFIAELKKERFSYTAGADQWSGAGLEAADLRLAGSGDEHGTITVVDSNARFQGGSLQANGTYVSEGGDVNLRVKVSDLPMGNLAPQIGIPEEWNVAGNITGTMELSATSGELRRIVGTVNVARGFVARSQAVFPWTNATAQVDWKPDGVRLDQINIQGNGIQLLGAARVGGPATVPIPRRRYEASGTVTATNTQSVAALAEVLAFSTPVAGSWGVRHATVDFKAQGIVGALQNSRATGKLAVSELMLRPNPQSTPLMIHSIRGDLVRGPDVLRLEKLRATADGLTGTGDLEIIPTTRARAGTYSAAGEVSLTNLEVLRRQVPDLPFWQWLRPARAESRGVLTFNVSGPNAAPQAGSGRGSFRFQEFDVAVNAGQPDQVWTFPIRELTGTLSMQGNRVAARELKLRSDLFSGGGEVALSPIAENGRVTGNIRVASGRWQELPPLKGRIPPGLSGGRLVLETRISGTASQSRLPMAGVLSLQDARYTGTYKRQQRTAKLDAARVAFRTEGERIRIPSYRVVTPQFRTSGSGTLTPAGEAWQVDAQGLLTTSDAGGVLRWWTGKSSLVGGRLTARYDLDARTDRPEAAVVDARVRITDARPLLPAGTLPFSAADARIVAATGHLIARGSNVRFRDVVWRAPRFTITGDGSLTGNRLVADFGLATPHWRAIAGELARSLPVSGGTLSVTGHIDGNVNRLKSAPVRGTVALRGAQLASDRNASLPVEGGLLDLKARVNGTLNNLVGSRIAGDFSLRDLMLPALAAGRARIGIRTARGRFERVGTRVTLSDFVADASGARLTGSGVLRGVGAGQASHSFRLTASGSSLASLVPVFVPLPGRASGGRFSGSLTVSGTAADPVRELEARAQASGAEWTPPRQTQALKIDRVGAHFTRRGDRGTLHNAEIRINGGTATLAGSFQGLNSPRTARHNLRLTWRLEDTSAWASRFLPVPGRFTGGLFTGNAVLAGTYASPAATARGDFRLSDAGFMPPDRVLGGPVRPISVNSALGRFHRAGGRTVLDRLELNTSIGTATGEVTATDSGTATVNARVNIARFEPLIDLWPGFKDKIIGGRGEMTIALRGPLRNPRRLAGTVDIRASGGTLTVENVDPLYANQPFEELSTHLVLPGSGAVRLENVKMRGPRANLDGQAVVAADGTLYGKGKAWFSKQYTKQLVKPKFLYPVAKLFGHGRLHSRFEIHGTLQAARLDMGITDSLLWKAGLKRKVPEFLRNIATGRAPIWDGRYAAPRVAGR